MMEDDISEVIGIELLALAKAGHKPTTKVALQPKHQITNSVFLVFMCRPACDKADFLGVGLGKFSAFWACLNAAFSRHLQSTSRIFVLIATVSTTFHVTGTLMNHEVQPFLMIMRTSAYFSLFISCKGGC